MLSLVISRQPEPFSPERAALKLSDGMFDSLLEVLANQQVQEGEKAGEMKEKRRKKKSRDEVGRKNKELQEECGLNLLSIIFYARFRLLSLFITCSTHELGLPGGIHKEDTLIL